jgi:hypothetical protein
MPPGSATTGHDPKPGARPEGRRPGGAFLWMISPTANFLTAFACGVLGTLFFAIKGKEVDAGVGPAAQAPGHG